MKLALYALTFFVLNFICKSLTDDFSPQHLTEPALPGSKWDLPLCGVDSVESLLDQPYTYLAKGKQAYVLLSKDKQHVIKLFKPPSPYIKVSVFGKAYHIGLAKLPFIKALSLKKDSESYLRTREIEFQSYYNSFTLLPGQTQLEYLHLAKTSHLSKTLTYYDKIGVKRTLDLDATSFLVQKRSDLLYPTLAKLLKLQDLTQAKDLLRNFVSFYLDLIDQDILSPTTLEKNLGCSSELKPIQIDVGRVLTPKDLQLSEIKVPLNQVYKSTSHMKKWLKVRSPELYLYLKQVEEELVTKRSKS